MLEAIYASLGIDDEILERYVPPRQQEAAGADLDVLGMTEDGRTLKATRATIQQWTGLQHAAGRAGILIHVTSAFRSVEYQAHLIARKLEAGQTLSAILAVNALPGFSEHHTGCALDLFSPPHPPLVTTFENTPAFAWLTEHADEFGFSLSYPRNNTAGFTFEPWHWRFNP